MQKISFGFLGLKPKEFWELQPKDIILMNEGFQMKQQYNERLHLETLRLLRHNSYVNYLAIPTKKGSRKTSLTKFYPLPHDPKSEVLTIEQAKEKFFKREPFITNGKLRGYLGDKSNELFSKEGILIAYIEGDLIKYIN